MPDFHQRLQLLEAVQKGELLAVPVHPFPRMSNKFAVRAYNKIIGKSGMRKYWLLSNDFALIVNIPVVDFRTFIHATLALVPKAEEIKMLDTVSAEGDKHDSVEAQ